MSNVKRKDFVLDDYKDLIIEQIPSGELMDSYKEIILGNHGRFPMGTWTKYYDRENTLGLLKFLFIDILKLNYSELNKVDLCYLLKEFRLYSMFSIVYGRAISYLMDDLGEVFVIIS